VGGKKKLIAKRKVKKLIAVSEEKGKKLIARC